MSNKEINNQEKIGSVMVVGAGIAGIQASLDLAESGYYVYLIEDSPAIGGVMSSLDKTFPTNDCAMCTLSPKLVECGRHLNVKTITNSRVESIEGNPGNFKVKIKKRSAYVDVEKCTGCGECEKNCPVEDVKSEFDKGLINRKAIYRPYPQCYPSVFTVTKKDRPPCGITCPANVNVQGYIALIREKKYAEALSLIKERNPLPAICGRVCFHPCEDNCRRHEIDEPLSIDALKRFVADLEFKGEISLKDKKDEIEKRDEKIAIVGSGPAGLTAAYDLANLGYKVTIFEKLSSSGGMLRVGIPSYRLPNDILDKEINDILNLGVEIRLNTEVKSIEELEKQDYKAVLLAVGAHKSMKLGIEGEDTE
ncbi:MAG: FAD-dependent oxidoreductase, partial [bacterium]|nr:FAD-dependent oxidoreductase [bacterium]